MEAAGRASSATVRVGTNHPLRKMSSPMRQLHICSRPGERQTLRSTFLFLVCSAACSLGSLAAPGLSFAAPCTDTYWLQIVEPSPGTLSLLASHAPPAGLKRYAAGDPAGAPGSAPAEGNPSGVERSLSSGGDDSFAVLREQLLRAALTREALTEGDRELILEAYQQKRWGFFFVSSTLQISPDARRLLERLGDLETDAIDPRPYRVGELHNDMQRFDEQRRSPDPALRAGLADLLETCQRKFPDGERAGLCQRPDLQALLHKVQAAGDQDVKRPAARLLAAFAAWHGELSATASQLDVRLAAGLVRFARDMGNSARERVIASLTGALPMERALHDLEPSSPHYQPLRAALPLYRDLARRYTPRRIPFHGTMHPGEQGPTIRALHERLREEGFSTGDARAVYDARLTEALRNFQRQHALEPDGVLGARTVEWLNVPYTDKVQMIEQSLAALRRSATRAYDRYARINLPQFTLEYYREGRMQQARRVIIGNAAGKKVKVRGELIGENQTPTLVSAINQVVLNPRWYVSDRISLELDVEAAHDPGYFERHGYVRMSTQYPWGSQRLYQLPGPKNPLGRVKFEFPNPYAVFLHDTPKKHLFQRARRDFSHGCLRLEGAVDFARTLLIDDQNPAADRVDLYLASYSPTRHIELRTPVPIVIEYLTASSDAQGKPVFLGDPYGWLEAAGAKPS